MLPNRWPFYKRLTEWEENRFKIYSFPWLFVSPSNKLHMFYKYRESNSWQKIPSGYKSSTLTGENGSICSICNENQILSFDFTCYAFVNVNKEALGFDRFISHPSVLFFVHESSGLWPGHIWYLYRLIQSQAENVSSANGRHVHFPQTFGEKQIEFEFRWDDFVLPSALWEGNLYLKFFTVKY